ncbi:MAG: aminotransferase class IV, partial [Desulforhopalus sp.]
MNIYYVNGTFVEETEARISVNDLSVLRGYGVFDFLRTYNGVPFHLEDHLLRLERSARLIALDLPAAPVDIKAIVLETLRRNRHDDSNIRLVVTGGESGDGITPGTAPQLMVMISEVSRFPAKVYAEGVKVITSHVERFMPGAKSINYIPAILCQAEARNQHAAEAIFVDRDGYLLEGTTSNFFAVIGNTLITPPCDRLLAGITREVVLNLARDHFPIRERKIHKDEVRLFEEAFITSSVKEVMPVKMIDSVKLAEQ